MGAARQPARLNTLSPSFNSQAAGVQIMLQRTLFL